MIATQGQKHLTSFYFCGAVVKLRALYIRSVCRTPTPVCILEIVILRNRSKSHENVYRVIASARLEMGKKQILLLKSVNMKD